MTMFLLYIKYLILAATNIQYITSSRIKDSCKTCRDIVKNFHEGMERTAKDHFGGGDTAWEESRLGSYARSETRLLEILEKVCEGADKESRCHAIVEEYEEKIEDFWFNKHKELKDLEKYLCLETFQVCCPEGKYGDKCSDCPGGAEKPCNGNGECDGSGTRSGDGKCKCNDGYTGDVCENCDEGFYDDGNKTCSKCHESCESTCRDGTPKGCDECAEGYVNDEQNGCVDKNECEEDDICVEGKFCINTRGSYRCQDCDPACDGGCTGTGRRSCNKCKEGWREIEGEKGCEDINECEERSDNDRCSVGTYCQNTEGSFQCEPCHTSCSGGCTGEGRASCLGCADGYEMQKVSSDDKESDEKRECVDVDQCARNLIECTHGEVCVNVEGKDSCEACHTSCKECVNTDSDGCLNCREGYLLKDSKCTDINECEIPGVCNKQTENCHNNDGSFKCKCKKGWVRTKEGDCVKKEKKKDNKKQDQETATKSDEQQKTQQQQQQQQQPTDELSNNSKIEL